MVPTGLANGPLRDSARASGRQAGNPFDQLLPSGLQGLDNADTPVADGDGFPLPEGMGDLDSALGGDATDTDKSADDFDFSEITAGVPGAAELLNGGRRLQGTDEAEVSSLLFGSANLAL